MKVQLNLSLINILLMINLIMIHLMDNLSFLFSQLKLYQLQSKNHYQVELPHCLEMEILEFKHINLHVNTIVLMKMSQLHMFIMMSSLILWDLNQILLSMELLFMNITITPLKFKLFKLHLQLQVVNIQLIIHLLMLIMK